MSQFRPRLSQQQYKALGKPTGKRTAHLGYW